MSIEGREKYPITFDRLIEAGITEAFRRISERYGLAEGLDYHNAWHTKNVIRRTKTILKAIASTDQKTARLGELTAAWHDVVQNFNTEEETIGLFTKKMRKRSVVENEETSAEEACDYLDALSKENGNAILFSDTDREVVRRGIHVTIPDFHPEQGTVIQPNLTHESDLVARAVALADIGAAGMDGPDIFGQEGDALFREENIDISDALRNQEYMSPSRKEFFRGRMIEWSEGQEQFAAGRKALFDAELQGLSKEEQEAVRPLFSKFDESIQGMREKTERRKEMPFDELVRDFGYTK